MGARHLNLGAWGERYVLNALQRAGLQAEYATSTKAGDITTIIPETGEVVAIEVKTAEQGNRGYWQYCLKKAGCTDVAHADYVILLACVGGVILGIYVLPSKVLAGKQKIDLTRRGKWQDYRVSDMVKGLRKWIQ